MSFEANFESSYATVIKREIVNLIFSDGLIFEEKNVRNLILNNVISVYLIFQRLTKE
jgi:hypothetical protein